MLTFTQKLHKGQGTVHGTAVSWFGKGLLFIGPSGSGKSDLALRLKDKGAALIADDQVRLTFLSKGIELSCPQEIKGSIEAFGMGILACETISLPTPLSLICLMKRGPLERLPDLSSMIIENHSIAYKIIDPFWPSTPEKLKLFLTQ